MGNDAILELNGAQAQAQAQARARGREEQQQRKELDAGAIFVLESKGTWLHAGYHLSTAIVGPAILSLPFALANLGWIAGTLALALGAAVTFYGYNLISLLLEQAEEQGQRHLRFRDLANEILGPAWSFYVVAPIQFVISFGAVVGSLLLCGQGMVVSSVSFCSSHQKFSRGVFCAQKIYDNLVTNGELKLYHFIVFTGCILIFMAQLPSFHSLRHLSLISALLSLGYSIGIVAACICAGHSERAPAKSYTFVGSTSAKVFHSFNGLAIIAATYGASLIPEIQATIAPPVSGKMFKGLVLCYAVVVTTFFSVSISGYWAFGNKATGNLFDNIIPDDDSVLAPKWLLFLIILFIILQLFAIALVYSQPLFEFFEGRLSDARSKVFSWRNLLPRVGVRSVYIAVAGLLAAMLPFFGDLNALIGAVGFLPLAFVLPPVLYNAKHRPSPQSLAYWANAAIIVIYTSVSVLGTISSIRQLVLDAHEFKLFSNNTS